MEKVGRVLGIMKSLQIVITVVLITVLIGMGVCIPLKMKVLLFNTLELVFRTLQVEL